MVLEDHLNLATTILVSRHRVDAKSFALVIDFISPDWICVFLYEYCKLIEKKRKNIVIINIEIK